MVVDHLRAKEREGRAFERVASFQAPHGGDPADDIGNQHDVRAAMNELTEEQRQVIELRYYGGLTTAEIAIAMEKTERAVYSLEVRALGALRRVLQPNSDPVRNVA